MKMYTFIVSEHFKKFKRLNVYYTLYEKSKKKN